VRVRIIFSGSVNACCENVTEVPRVTTFMGNFPACSQQETFMACDTMDEVCYSGDDDNDDCDEQCLERVPGENHCCKDRGIFVTTSWLFN
jgi:hypothetical protein